MSFDDWLQSVLWALAKNCNISYNENHSDSTIKSDVIQHSQFCNLSFVCQRSCNDDANIPAQINCSISQIALKLEILHEDGGVGKSGAIRVEVIWGLLSHKSLNWSRGWPPQPEAGPAPGKLGDGRQNNWKLFWGLCNQENNKRCPKPGIRRTKFQSQW